MPWDYKRASPWTPFLYCAYDTWSWAMSRTKSSWFKWKLTNLTPLIVYTHTSHHHLISQLSADNKKKKYVCRGLCLFLPVSLLLGKFSYQFVPASCPPVGVWTPPGGRWGASHRVCAVTTCATGCPEQDACTQLGSHFIHLGMPAPLTAFSFSLSFK